MKKERTFELILIIAIMAGALYAAFSDAHNFPNRWFTRDDAYYYFKVAQNISEGLGSTFDGVNLANGYHPLWMLINIPVFALARFDLVLPLRILLLVMAALHAASAILLYRLVSRTLSPLVGSLIAIYWAFSIYLHQTITQYGLETGLTAFTIIFFIHLFQKKEHKTRSEPLTLRDVTELALAAVLVMFSRLDTVFLVILFGLYLVFRKTPIRYLALTDILGIVLIGLLSFILRVGIRSYLPYGKPALMMVILSVVVSLLTYYFLGLYRHPRLDSPFALLKKSLLAVLVAEGIVAVLLFGLGRLGLVTSFPRSALLVNFLGILFWVLLSRFGMRSLSPVREHDVRPPLVLLRESWQLWLREGLTYFGIVGGALGAYMLFSKLVFGTPSPVSGQIKRWWGNMSGRVYGGSAKEIYTFFGFDTSYASDFSAWGLASKFVIQVRDGLVRFVHYPNTDNAYWLLFILIVILLIGILLASRKRTLRTSVDFSLLPLLVASFIQIISYHATGYSAAKEWYWVSHIIFTLLLLAVLLDVFFRALLRLHPVARQFSWSLVGIVALVMGLSFYSHVLRLMPYGVELNGHHYMDILAVVEENTEPGAFIGMTGGGNLGYFIADRTIVNMDGLINSYDYFLAHKEGRADEYLAAMGMDYVFSNPDILADLPYQGEFVGRLGEPVASFGNKMLLPFYLIER